MVTNSNLNINDVLASLGLPNSEPDGKKYRKVTLAPGEVLFHRGDHGGDLFYVTKGHLEVVREGENGFEVKLADRGVGSFIGITSFFDEHNERADTLRATVACELWSFDQTWLREALSNREAFAFKFISYLSRQLRAEMDERSALLSRQPERGFRLVMFDAKKYEQEAFDKFIGDDIKIHYIDTRLTSETVAMTSAASAVCVFVNDHVDRPVLEAMASYGIGLVVLRCAGFNNVDLEAAKALGISVTRVPAYSPYAVAEHALAMMMSLNRKIHRAYNRIREGNFYLNRLVGFDMHGRTAGVIGTGKIGKCMVNILSGMGMKVLGWDAFPDQELARESGMQYVELDDLLSRSDVISLHVPLTPETYHLIDARAFEKMKPEAMLINTSRGGLVDAKALIDALKKGHLGAAGLDVYEEEEEYFFTDHSGQIIDDDTLVRLISFPNVLITSHQAFLTRDALENIAETTLASVREYKEGKRLSDLTYQVTAP